MAFPHVAVRPVAILVCLCLPAWIVVEQAREVGSWALIDPIIRDAVRSRIERERNHPAADQDEAERWSAIETYGTGLITESQYALAEHNRAQGRASLDQHDWDRAINCFKRQIRGEWLVADALFDLGTAYAMQGDLERALAHLEQAVAAGFFRVDQIESAPGLGAVRQDRRFADVRLRAMSTAALKRYGGATLATLRDQFRDHLQAHPDDGPALHRFGCASAAAGDLDAAVNAFERQAEIGFSSGTAFYNLACCLARKGRSEAAFDYLEKAVAAGPPPTDLLRADPDLDGLREDPRFEHILSSMDQRRG
ncbi:MAG: tetratricopeptide repeat protein [Planctomycetota bacterium]